VFADDRVTINLIHETGKAPSSEPVDNQAVYVSRLRPVGEVDRLWTVDLDTEHREDFWARNPGMPSKDFS
jgi:hypothetical protein